MDPVSSRFKGQFSESLNNPLSHQSKTSNTSEIPKSCAGFSVASPNPEALNV